MCPTSKAKLNHPRQPLLAGPPISIPVGFPNHISYRLSCHLFGHPILHAKQTEPGFDAESERDRGFNGEVFCPTAQQKLSGSAGPSGPDAGKRTSSAKDMSRKGFPSLPKCPHNEEDL